MCFCDWKAGRFTVGQMGETPSSTSSLTCFLTLDFGSEKLLNPKREKKMVTILKWPQACRDSNEATVLRYLLVQTGSLSVWSAYLKRNWRDRTEARNGACVTICFSLKTIFPIKVFRSWHVVKFANSWPQTWRFTCKFYCLPPTILTTIVNHS